MKTHCSSCKKVTVYKNSCVRKTKQNRLMLLSIVLFVARIQLLLRNQILLKRIT